MGNLAVDQGYFEASMHFFEKSSYRNRLQLGGPGWAYIGLMDFDRAKLDFQAKLEAMLTYHTKIVGLDGIIGMAHLKARVGDVTATLELLTLVRNHPASNYEIKKKANSLWGELVAELSSELIAEAKARGRELDLFETAEALLAEQG